MKIIVSRFDETLRKIANRTNHMLDELIRLNPQIAEVDAELAGTAIYLPDRPAFRQPDIYLPPDCPYVPSPLATNDNKSWIPLTSLEHMEQIEYDVLIVGTGAGGGAVLSRLSEHWRNSGKRIGVIERGDLLIPTHTRNIATMDKSRADQFMNAVFQPVSTLSSQYEGAKQLFAVGGRTLFWGAVSPRVYPGFLAKGVVPLDEMDFYYNLAEQLMSVNQNYTQDSSLSLKILEQLWNDGFPHATFLPLATDLQQTKYGHIHSNTYFSSIISLAQALNVKPFDLAVNARAIQVLTEQGHITGVKVLSENKQSYVLRAKTVVLAASTFETPRILLCSGIGGPAVGHYLENHSFILSTGTLKRDDFPEVLGTLALLIPQKDEQPFEIEIHGPGKYEWYQYLVEQLQNELSIVLYGIGCVESRYQNYVALDPSKLDNDGIPELDIHFSYSHTDKMVINQLNEAMKKTAEIIGLFLQPPICLQPPGLLDHHVGTCRMGYDPATSVTDPHGQVHGVSGLYIADNSVLSSYGAANPTLTCVALALRTADFINRSFQG